MREIAQQRTPTLFGGERQPADHRLRHLGPVHRSGRHDRPRRGPAALRARWIEERGDTEALAG
jgi:phosphomethylpyrimidine synthase